MRSRHNRDFAVLRHLGMLEKQEYTIETKSGILRIRVDENGLIFMEQNTPEFYERLDKADVEACFEPDASPIPYLCKSCPQD